MKNALILLAGGTGKRFVIAKNTKPKQFLKVGNNNFIEYFLGNLDEKIFDIIQIVAKKSLQKKYLSNLKKDFPEHQINFIESDHTKTCFPDWLLNKGCYNIPLEPGVSSCADHALPQLLVLCSGTRQARAKFYRYSFQVLSGILD